MLNKKENVVMWYILKACSNKKSVLLSPSLIIENCKIGKNELNEKELNIIMQNLSIDNYIELINTENNGEFWYCISLRDKGKTYAREIENRRREFCRRLVITLTLAVISFVAGILLKIIF